jgi:polar amino acid transport system substrate-binding protein
MRSTRAATGPRYREEDPLSPRRPHLLAVVALAGTALTLTACGSSSLSSPGTTSSISVSAATSDAALTAALPDKVKTAKKIVVGTDATYAPSEFLAGDGKTVQGFDIDLFTAVAQKLGVGVEFVPAKFDSIITGVQGGKYDIGVSSFTINPDRKKQVNMVSYFTAGTQWAAAKGNPKKVAPDAACGLTVAVQTGTVEETDDLPKRQTACKSASKPAIKVLSYSGQDQATAAVASGKADAMLADSPVAAYAVKQSSGALEAVGTVYDSAPYGYVVPKAQTQFAAAIATALKALQTDGTYATVLQKWGVTNGAATDFAVNP